MGIIRYGYGWGGLVVFPGVPAWRLHLGAHIVMNVEGVRYLPTPLTPFSPSPAMGDYVHTYVSMDVST